MEKSKLTEMIKNGPRVVGLRQVLKEITKDAIKCVVVSKDCEPFVLETVEDKLSGKEIPVYVEFKASELGKICKIDVSASVVGILVS